MTSLNEIVHEHPDSFEQMRLKTEKTGTAAVDEMRLLACQIDPTGLKIDKRVEVCGIVCDFIETAAGHTFCTNMHPSLADIQA